LSRLTAIIPTHERPAELRRCLETLAVQDVPPTDFEVIVIDDGSEADVGAVVDEVSIHGRVAMRVERQKLSGLNAARNRGAAIADGQLLAFLDDDTLVSPGWAAALLRAFDQDECAGVGGRVALRLAGAEPEWLDGRRSYLAEFELGDEAHWLDHRSLPVGANCAVRRTEFDRLGGFLVGLDRIGESLVSNGDTEFFLRLHSSGGRLRYEPAASVVHCVPADRLTVDFFAKRRYAQGVSDELLLTLQGVPPSWRRRARLAWRLGRAAPIFAKGILSSRGTVNARLWASYWRGRLAAVGEGPKAAGGQMEPSSTGAGERFSS
jgi:GT2 family glycosyltransferase